MQTTIQQVHAMYTDRIKAELSSDATIAIEAEVKKSGDLECTVLIWHQNSVISCGIAPTFSEAYNRAFIAAQEHITPSVEVVTINDEQL
jgi:hypothetical protein